jgi:hypothetical protein
MKTLSVLFAFGLLFAACYLAARLYRAGLCPATRNEAARQPARSNGTPSAHTWNSNSPQQLPKRHL